METSYTPPVTGVSQNKTQLFLIIGLVVALLIGFIAVFQAVRLQNRASEVALPGMCKEVVGTCSLPSDTPEQKDFIKRFINEGGKLIVRTQDKNEDVKTTPLSATSVRFSAISGVSYLCRIKKSDGNDFEGVCASPAVNSGTCPATTPVISTPTSTLTPTATPTTSQVCENCGKPGLKCSAAKSPAPTPIESSGSCPALSYWDITYSRPINDSCAAQFPLLDCSKHEVIVRSGSNIKSLSDTQCNALVAIGGSYLLRLHTGDNTTSCRKYEIEVQEKGTDKILTNILECGDDCKFEVGCPQGCWSNGQTVETTQLSKPELIDIPDLKNDDLECPANDNCGLKVTSGACGQYGDTATFAITAKSNIARIYLDDQFGSGKAWETVTNMVNGQGTFTHKFNNSGYFDVVLECKSASTEGTQHYYCAHRITRMCSEVTPPACIQIAPPKLDMGECQDCAPTRSPCDPKTGANCGGANPTSITTN